MLRPTSLRYYGVMYTLVLLCRRGLANFRQPVLSFAEAEDVAGSKWRYAKLLKLDKCNLVHHALARRHIGTRRRHGGEAGGCVVQRETSNGLRRRGCFRRRRAVLSQILCQNSARARKFSALLGRLLDEILYVLLGRHGAFSPQILL